MSTKEILDLLIAKVPPPKGDTAYVGPPTSKVFSDVAAFASLYGSGWINSYLRVLPMSSLEEETNEFRETIATLAANHDEKAAAILTRFDRADRSLSVWATSINGETLLVEGKLNAETEKVICVSSHIDVVSYWCTAPEFLFNLSSGNFKGEFFSKEMSPPLHFTRERFPG